MYEIFMNLAQSSVLSQRIDLGKALVRFRLFLCLNLTRLYAVLSPVYTLFFMYAMLSHSFKKFTIQTVILVIRQDIACNISAKILKIKQSGEGVCVSM